MKLDTKWTKRREKSIERSNICKDCDEYVAPKGLDPLSFCNQCKCPIAIKTMFPSEECPLGKWNPYYETCE